MKVYKLTDENGRTYGGTQWGEGVTHRVRGGLRKLCTMGWIHAYEHELLATLLNPIHANFPRPRLWEAVGGRTCLRDGQLKIGFKTLTTVREIPVPEVTLTQRIAFGILAAKEVYGEPSWIEWADNWLTNPAARTATRADAAYDTARAAYAAYAAAVADDDTTCVDATRDAAYAAYRAARDATRVDATRDARTATITNAHLNLIEIANAAMLIN